MAATLATTVSLRSLGEDPLTFGIQLGRRIPASRPALLALAAAAPALDRELLRRWVGGDLDAVRAMLLERPGGVRSRIAGEIAHAAGLPELVADDPAAHPLTRARAAWQLGDASGAVALLGERAPSSRLLRTLTAELALMTPGTRLPLVGEPRRPLAAGRGVLHLLTNSLPHTQSGYTVRSHAALLAQREAGLAPTAMTRIGYPVVVGGLKAHDVDVVDGLRYVRAIPARLAPTPDGRLLQQAAALEALAVEAAPAGLQTTTHYPNALVVREVADRLGLPWAYEVRGMLEQTWVASLASDEARERAASSERFSLTRERESELASAADGVFTLGDAMRDDLVARGVERDRVRLVPNGIDEASLGTPTSDPASARAALGLPEAGFWVGSTSSIVDYEGFDVLLDAVAIARGRGRDVRALVVGDGTALPGLRAHAAALGIGDAVVLPGRVPREQAAAHRDALDAVVVPRLDRAVTRTVAPLKPIEAMAAGRPLLVSDLPPLRDTVGEALVRAGAVVAAGDSRALADRIAALADDPQLGATLGALGRDRAAGRTWRRVGETYRDTWRIVAPEAVWDDGSTAPTPPAPPSAPHRDQGTA